MNDKQKCCEECQHFITWEEYGNVLNDCENLAASDFIDMLDGVQDAAEAGCPYFKQDEGEQR